MPLSSSHLHKGGFALKHRVANAIELSPHIANGAYQTEKTKLEMQRIATYLTEEEREVFFSWKGFVCVPEEERLWQRIDAYPYLIP